MSVVARMKVFELKQNNWGTTVSLQPETPAEGDPHHDEIKAFYAATPTGRFEATITNELAAEQFQLGDTFYISLERVPRP